MKRIFLILAFFLPLVLWAQEKEQALTYSGTRIQGESEVDSTGKLFLGGYVDTYYALYSDKTPPGNFVKFPTASPRNNNAGLNLLQLQAKYGSEKVRGVATIFYGDIPTSAWSPDYNMIQEANMGLRLHHGLWIDVGFFRTHLGLESIQPRENIASSIAIPTYFEPYFLSGAKLTYEINTKLRFMLCVLNGFNTFVDRNNNKAVGLSGVYDFSSKTSLVVNTLMCDESAPYSAISRNRIYNNLYFTHKTARFDYGAEFNFGVQEHSKLTDSTKTASVMSGLISAKYHINKKFAVYGRGEFYEDSDEILTGPVENQYHQLVGVNLLGGTVGLEFTPIRNSYLRLEGRVLHTTQSETIFTLNGSAANNRYEGILALGVWF